MPKTKQFKKRQNKSKQKISKNKRRQTKRVGRKTRRGGWFGLNNSTTTPSTTGFIKNIQNKILTFNDLKKLLNSCNQQLDINNNNYLFKVLLTFYYHNYWLNDLFSYANINHEITDILNSDLRKNDISYKNSMLIYIDNFCNKNIKIEDIIDAIKTANQNQIHFIDTNNSLRLPIVNSEIKLNNCFDVLYEICKKNEELNTITRNNGLNYGYDSDNDKQINTSVSENIKNIFTALLNNIKDKKQDGFDYDAITKIYNQFILGNHNIRNYKRVTKINNTELIDLYKAVINNATNPDTNATNPDTNATNNNITTDANNATNTTNTTGNWFKNFFKPIASNNKSIDNNYSAQTGEYSHLSHLQS